MKFFFGGSPLRDEQGSLLISLLCFAVCISVIIILPLSLKFKKDDFISENFSETIEGNPFLRDFFGIESTDSDEDLKDENKDK